MDYQPSEIPYRDDQIGQIASILAPVLRGERPSNLFLYGKTGTGKTLSVQYVRDELMRRIKKESKFNEVIRESGLNKEEFQVSNRVGIYGFG